MALSTRVARTVVVVYAVAAFLGFLLWMGSLDSFEHWGGPPGGSGTRNALTHSNVIEPWESVYMCFMTPGLYGWWISLVFWVKFPRSRISIAAQVFFAIEIAMGGMMAFAKGMLDSGAVGGAVGSYDPSEFHMDHHYFGTIALIGWVLHVVLLSSTGMAMILTWRLSKASGPAAALVG